LFNTGTVAWFYRCLIENLFGVVGCKQGLRIAPQLPDDWQSARITRKFRGATFNVVYTRNSELTKAQVTVDGQIIADGIISNIQVGKTSEVRVELPLS
jgi:cellobionic acid phosphorylase